MFVYLTMKSLDVYAETTRKKFSEFFNECASMHCSIHSLSKHGVKFKMLNTFRGQKNRFSRIFVRVVTVKKVRLHMLYCIL